MRRSTSSKLSSPNCGFASRKSDRVGAIHGRLLTAWSVAGILGPVFVNYIRVYLKSRGATGVGLYAPTMYLMAGLLVVGLICNLMVRPVYERFYYHKNCDR